MSTEVMDDTEGLSFGDWTKRQRRALDLTQEGLAEHVGCSVDAIKKIEGGRLRPSRQLAELIVDCLGAPPARRSAFVRWARDGTLPAPPATSKTNSTQQSGPKAPSDDSSGKAGDRSLTNLPSIPTPLVGREPEIAAVRQIIGKAGETGEASTATRLLTLTGPPGVGKTRLAISAAATLLTDFADGVWFVPLAPVRDPALVGATIAGILGVQESGKQALADVLANSLRGKDLLLVLDNFEQVLDAAPLLGQLLSAAGGLKVLVTSRAVLQLYGEHEFRVPPLSLPNARATATELLSRYEAIELFRQRAAAVSPGFTLSSETAPVVSEICGKLDGLPLAIELAASRARLLSPQAILARLEERLKLLVGGARDLPPRQQTLWAAIEWSYDLLSESEQQFFRYLGVFSGGCTLAAIAEVCNHGGQRARDAAGAATEDAMGVVESLVAKSLLNTDPGFTQTGGSTDSVREQRFWVLETIHEYARVKLRESGEEADLRSRHALFYMKLAEEASVHLSTAAQQEWLGRLEADQANLRAALHWATSATGESTGVESESKQGDLLVVEVSLRLGAALGQFWEMRGNYSEGRAELARVIALAEALPPRPLPSPDDAEGGRLTEQARAAVLYWAAVLATIQGDYSAARALHEQALDIRQRLGDKRATAISLRSLGELSYLGLQKDPVAGRRMVEESLALGREVNDKQAIARSLIKLANIEVDNGDYVVAMAYTEEAWTVSQETEDRRLRAMVLEERAKGAWIAGDLAGSRSMLKESLQIYRELRDKNDAAKALFWLGWVAFIQGDYSTSKAECRESVMLYRETGSMWGFAVCLILLALLDAAGPDGNGPRTGRVAQRATRLLAWSEQLASGAASGMIPAAVPLLERGWADIRSRLGDEEVEQARTEGRSMTVEQAIELALSVADNGVTTNQPIRDRGAVARGQC